MSLNVLMLVVIRWAHILAGVAWVGGGLFYLLVLQPSLVDVNDQVSVKDLKARIAAEFKEVVEISLMALVVTGVILSFDRLSSVNVSNLYVAILALKVAAAGGMFLLSRNLGGTRSISIKGERAPTELKPIDLPHFVPRLLSPSQLVLALGILVFLLATLLQVIYERGLLPA